MHPKWLRYFGKITRDGHEGETTTCIRQAACGSDARVSWLPASPYGGGPVHTGRKSPVEFRLVEPGIWGIVEASRDCYPPSTPSDSEPVRKPHGWGTNGKQEAEEASHHDAAHHGAVVSHDFPRMSDTNTSCYLGSKSSCFPYPLDVWHVALPPLFANSDSHRSSRDKHPEPMCAGKVSRWSRQSCGGERRKCTRSLCNNLAQQGGVCISHGAQRRRCGIEGCTRQARTGGVCMTHGARKEGRKLCIHPACENYAIKKGVCITHGAEVKRCHISGCTRRAQKGGLCIGHGAHVKRPACSAPGCTKQAVSGGVCTAHGARRKHCTVSSCEKQALKGGVCIAHGAQMKRCRVSGCEKYPRQGGVCVAHGAKVKRCATAGCEKYPKKGGLCISHGAGSQSQYSDAASENEDGAATSGPELSDS